MLQLLSIPLLFFLLGTWAGIWGYRRHSLYKDVRETPTTAVSDLDEAGLVELTGTARPIDDETITGALSYKPCLATGWRADEWNDGSNTNSWAELGEGYDSTPFRLDDGTGEVRVDLGADASGRSLVGGLEFGDLDHSVGIGETTVDFDRMAITQEVAPDERTPIAVEDFVERQSEIAQQTDSFTNVVNVGPKDGARRYREGLIQPGDEVYLLGTVEPAAEADGEGSLDPESAVVRPSGDDPFVLSTRGESALRSDTWYGFVPYGVGLLLWGLGLVSLWVLFL